MDWNSISTVLSWIIEFPPAAYIAGIIIQCLSLLREKPYKWAVITFLGMLFYLSSMMIYSVFYYNHDNFNNNALEAVTPQIMVFGFIIAFLFIAVFLKSVVTIINEYVILSNTISYWFLIYETMEYFSGAVITLLIVLGIIASIASSCIFFYRDRIRNLYKYFLYGWYLFTNGLFAIRYFSGLPIDFFQFPAAINNGEVSSLIMLVIGMIVVHVLFNFGILYYSVMFSLISMDTRKDLLEYTKKIFSDRYVDFRVVRNMLFIQIAAFLVFEIFMSQLSFQFIALWILLVPVIVKIFHFMEGRFKWQEAQ
jgi:hypothetical protein